MEEARGSAVAAAVELLRAGTPVGASGEAGIGTTTFLDEIVSRLGAPAVRTGGLRSLRTAPYLPLTRAVGTDVGRSPTAVAAQVAAAVGDGVLVVDDLQFADPDTLEFIARSGSSTRLLVGIRRGDPGTSAAQVALAAAGGVLIRLAPLTTAEVESIIRSVRPGATADEVTSLVRHSAGNPAALHQLLASGTLSQGLTEALAACLADCTVAERCLLAVLGERDQGVPIADAGTSTDRLSSAGQVVVESGRVHLRHASIGDAAFASLDPTDQVRVHRRLAELSVEPGQQAAHLLAAGDPTAALPLALAAAAADRANDSVHLELAAQCVHGPERAQLLASATEAALRHGDAGRARQLAEQAMFVPGTTPTVSVLTAAAEAYACDGDSHAALAAVARVEEVGRAGEAEIDTQLWARVRAAGASALAWPLWRPIDAVVAAERAVATTALGTAPARSTLAALGVAHLVAGDPRWLESREAMTTAPRALGAMLDGRGTDAVDADAGAVSGADGGSELVRAVVALHTRGDCDGLAPRLHDLLGRLERPIDRELAGAHLVVALADSGRTSAAARTATDAMRSELTPAGAALMAWALIEAELTAGRLTKARKAYEQLIDTTPSPALTLAAVAATWAAALAPTAAARRPPLPAPAPWPGLAAAQVELEAIDLRVAGASAGRVDEAFTRAAEAWSTWHRRGELRCRWAAAHASIGGATRDEAVDRLRVVEDDAARLGQRPLVARVRASLRSAGVRTRPSRGTGRGPLSAREVEVLELVRLGFTSGEAAQSLGVAASTVDTQVESAMRKLGARTRLHAAALVAEVVS